MITMLSSDLLQALVIVLMITVYNIPTSLQAKTCPTNERLAECKSGIAPQTCDEMSTSGEGSIGWPGCEAGCVCKKNYLRNGDGVCIPKRQCRNCGGDYNATVGDGRHCGNLCSNYKDPYVICGSEQFGEYPCKCKKGFVYNTIKEKCVRPTDCPKSCRGDFYAEHKKCASNRRRTCMNPDIREVESENCVENGCDCILGYILDRPGGKCVKYEDCPDVGCEGDLNATVTSCSCGQPTCQTRYSDCAATGCIHGVVYTCACKGGYILNDLDGHCILTDDCGWKNY